MRVRARAAAWGLAACGLSGAPAWAGSYTFTTIDVPGYPNDTVPTGINDLNQVVGWAEGPQAGTTRLRVGFVWSAGAVTIIADPSPTGRPKFDVYATGIDDRGEVAGYRSRRDVYYQEALKFQDGKVTLLPTGTPRPNSATVGINRRGMIVGNLHDSSGSPTPFSYRAGVVTPYPGVGPNAEADGINARGDIVGDTDDTTADTGGGFVLSGGVPTGFAVSEPHGGQVVRVFPTFINDNGVVGGHFAFVVRNALYIGGFVRFPTGRIVTREVANAGGTELAGVDAAGDEFGNAINVGAHSAYFSFIYSGHGFERLEPPGAIYSAITGVNQQGSVVGTYFTSDYRPHGFLATCPTGPGTCSAP